MSTSNSTNSSAPVEDGPNATAPRNIGIAGTIEQCAKVNVTWEGGEPPVRVEFYQQQNDTASWNTVPNGMYNVNYKDFYGQHSLPWTVNVKPDQNLWIVIVDHTGYYSQTQAPFQVGSSDKDGCLSASDNDADDLLLGLNHHVSPLAVATLALWISTLIVAIILGIWVYKLRGGKWFNRRGNARRMSSEGTFRRKKRSFSNGKESISTFEVVRPTKPHKLDTLVEHKLEASSQSPASASSTINPLQTRSNTYASQYDGLPSSYAGTQSTNAGQITNASTADIPLVPKVSLSRDGQEDNRTLGDSQYGDEEADDYNPLSRLQSTRSSFAPSVESSQAYSIETEATVASSENQESIRGRSRPSSQRSVQQFFSLKNHHRDSQ